MASPPDELVRRLRAAGCVFAEEEAALLLAEAADAADPTRLEAMVRARITGSPLEQVLGWADFGGLRVLMAPGVFVPRRRTELLARLAARDLAPGDVVVDLCCGTGAVGAAVAAWVPGARVHAADVDPAAVACARLNLVPTRVHEGDLYDALPPALAGQVRVLAVNAPYVPTDAIALMPPEARDHEHRVALDGGSDGVDVQRRVAAGALAWLAPGGRLLVETGRRQVPLTVALLDAAGLMTEVMTDDEIGATVVTGTAASAPLGVPGLT